MSGNVRRLKPATGFVSTDEMMAQIRAHHPNAKRCIVIVFEDDGSMQPYFQCDGRDMAFAAARLAYLTNQE